MGFPMIQKTFTGKLSTIFCIELLYYFFSPTTFLLIYSLINLHTQNQKIWNAIYENIFKQHSYCVWNILSDNIYCSWRHMRPYFSPSFLKNQYQIVNHKISLVVYPLEWYHSLEWRHSVSYDESPLLHAIANFNLFFQ